MADGVIPSEEQWRRIMAAVEFYERGAAGGPAGGRSSRYPGQLPPERWAKLTARTAGTPDNFAWSEVVRDGAGTWKLKPAADNPATSATFGVAYEINGLGLADGIDPSTDTIYVRLFPIWNPTDAVFEYRFIYGGALPTPSEEHDVITAVDVGGGVLQWQAGDVKAKPS